MDWTDIPSVMDDWVLKTAAVAYDVRQSAANVITDSHVSYYYDPTRALIGIFAPLALESDLARVKSAAEHAAPSNDVLFLTYQQLEDPAGSWVKIAYSPTIRRAGELLNFFPGQFPGGVPNSPSPVAAMLTSGLVGAGLGWGGGKLLERVLPERFGKKLGRTGAILGGALGAAPGAAWGLANHVAGRSFNDPTLLDGYPGEDAQNVRNDGDVSDYQKPQQTDLSPYMTNMPRFHKFGEALDAVALCPRYRAACEKTASTFGHRLPHAPGTPVDVNIDALGRTLWDTEAPPALAATTMAGMYAAQQLPDENSRPGWATGHQLGQLAQQTIGDYAKGYLVGAALNAAIGTPLRASTFGLGNVALGVISTVVPKLFGG